MVVGEGTISDGPNSVVLEDVKDGTGCTIAVVETTDSGIPWYEPRDLEFDEMSFKINDEAGGGIQGEHPWGCNVAFCDGSVHCLSEDTPPEILKALFTIAGGEDVREFFMDP